MGEGVNAPLGNSRLCLRRMRLDSGMYSMQCQAPHAALRLLRPTPTLRCFVAGPPAASRVVDNRCSAGVCRHGPVYGNLALRRLSLAPAFLDRAPPLLCICTSRPTKTRPHDMRITVGHRRALITNGATSSRARGLHRLPCICEFACSPSNFPRAFQKSRI
jgi:hypothetical protein